MAAIDADLLNLIFYMVCGLIEPLREYSESGIPKFLMSIGAISEMDNVNA